MKLSFFYNLIINIALTYTCYSNEGSPRASTNHKSVYLIVSLPNVKLEDSLYLAKFDSPLDAAFNQDWTKNVKSIKLNRNKLFEFKLESVQPYFYFSLFKDWNSKGQPKNILHWYLLKQGDSVRMDVVPVSNFSNCGDCKYLGGPDFYSEYGSGKYRFIFTGIGAKKFSCKYEIDQTSNLAPTYLNTQVLDLNGNFFNEGLTDYDFIKAKSLEILEKYKAKLDGFVYKVMKLDILGQFNRNWNIEFSQSILRAKRVTDSTSLFLKNASILLDQYPFQAPSNQIINFKEEQLFSVWYALGIIEMEYAVNASVGLTSLESLYSVLKRNYQGKLRDMVLTCFLLARFQYLKNPFSTLQDALPIINLEFCHKEIQNLLNTQMEGVKAYKFALPDINGNIIKLEDFRGKAVFIDFWYNGCVPCIAYYKNVVSKIKKNVADKSQIEFISISITKDKKEWIEAVKSGEYTSPDGINLNTNGKGSSHPIVEYYKIMSYPRSLLIDKNGNIFSTSLENLKSLEKTIQIINKAILIDTTHN